MYSGNTKNYYRKTVGHVFTKPVQTEGTNQKHFFPSKLFFIIVSHFCRQAMRVYVVRKWPLRGRSRFVCQNITRVSLWLLCNVYFVQNTQRTRLRDLADLKARIIAAVKHMDAPMLTRVWQELEYRIDVSPVVHTSNISSCQKKNTFSFPVAVNNSNNL